MCRCDVHAAIRISAGGADRNDVLPRERRPVPPDEIISMFAWCTHAVVDVMACKMSSRGRHRR
jgi:hypothetical protein